MMKKKTFFIINIYIVLLFAIYLVTTLFIDYPKYVKITVLSIYLLYAVMRAIYFIKNFKKLRKITNKTVRPAMGGLFAKYLIHSEK